MTYFAHTHPDAEWEPLAKHLTEVAALAKERGRLMQVEALAEQAGLLHDLGKYSAGFQERLRGGPRVDHATPGALWALQHLPPICGKILAHVVAGHHTGLQDGLFDPDGRIEQQKVRCKAALRSMERAALADGMTLSPFLGCPAGLKDKAGFELAFLTRMVFSCLIDADHLAAAAFEQDVPVEDLLTQHPSITLLDTALHAFFDARAVKPTALNQLRDQVLQAVLAQAAKQSNVFTLTVPTGGGKTLTALAFALARARAQDCRRVITVAPYSAIIEQTVDVYRQALGQYGDAVLEHHSGFDMNNEARWADDRVGPERLRLAMQRWDHPIVVTTAVQFFESLFANRTSRCRKLHSIARSVIVIDEAQTLPLHLLRPCVAALKVLAADYGCSVVLCTATQPALSAGDGDGNGFPGGFDAPVELAPNVPGLFAALRRVTVKTIGLQTDAELANHIAGSMQALCIVNTRSHARELFEAIKEQDGGRHLSTAMHAMHRRQVLADIKCDLKNERPCRVVATSLVEAGVDLNFRLALRAMTGLDQIAQAAGRCNREFSHSAAESLMLVFESAGHPPIEALRKQTETAREILTLFPDDPFGPDAIRKYFEMLYWRESETEFDRYGVMRDCQEHGKDLNFPFAKIAKNMRFIDDVMAPVIVPAHEHEPGFVQSLLNRLPHVKGRIGGIARELGPYTVGVPGQARTRLLNEGAARIVNRDQYGDQFVVLDNLDLYTAETGLNWSDPTFRTAEGLMV